MAAPHIVALGGTLRPESSTERALAIALRLAEAQGARTTLLTGAAIAFPPFDGAPGEPSPAVAHFVATMRSADALIIGSPGYHGSLSGLVKNALDYVELLRGDGRVYLDGMPVGLVATAAGWQGAVSTLHALRTVVHALRGWPTPLGVTINTSEGPEAVPAAERHLSTLVDQLLGFLRR